MNYSQNFKQLVSQCLLQNSYIGTGNPKAKILFAGKESAIKTIDIKGHIYNVNAFNWNDHIINNTCEELSYKPDNRNPELRRAGHTWRKYQILHDNIFSAPQRTDEEKYRINFLERVFTTEMNDAPAKRTAEAQKKQDFFDSLKARKQFFFTNPFIQDFPVVVLACGNYIQNYGENREIDTIFGVTFHEEHSVKTEKTEQKFWTHYNSEKTKLVIHCQQLSGSQASTNLLIKMGEVIRLHLESNNLL